MRCLVAVYYLDLFRHHTRAQCVDGKRIPQAQGISERTAWVRISGERYSTLQETPFKACTYQDIFSKICLNQSYSLFFHTYMPIVNLVRFLASVVAQIGDLVQNLGI